MTTLQQKKRGRQKSFHRFAQHIFQAGQASHIWHSLLQTPHKTHSTSQCAIQDSLEPSVFEGHAWGDDPSCSIWPHNRESFCKVCGPTFSVIVVVLITHEEIQERS